MHMADALISPAVGSVMWAASAGMIGYSAKKLKQEADEHKIPLMGVLGAFIFAAQMINFSIPGTGSSGHLGGGMILAILLGPYAAFLVMASVLVIQALFFADGGLLALGCNIFNLGFFPCFVAYPLIFRKIAGDDQSRRKIIIGAVLASVVGLQLGAFSVVLETLLSGISELPFAAFALLMLPIHLAIGVIEGLVTAAVVIFVCKARPEILRSAMGMRSETNYGIQEILLGLLIAAAVTGGVFSWFASANPDGLEWAMSRISGKEQLHGSAPVHRSLAAVQEKIAVLPDYGFKRAETDSEQASDAAEPWPAVNSGTSVSGLVGGILTLLLTAGIGWGLQRRRGLA